MAGYEGSLLDQPCEWFLVGFENLNFKVVREFFVVIFAAMSVHQLLEKCRLRSELLAFAVKLTHVLL